MGLTNQSKPIIREYGLDEPLEFGRLKGCTPREIIDDDEEGLLKYYRESIDGFDLTAETLAYAHYRI